MISKELHDVLIKQLDYSSRSDAPELVERLNLAFIILKKDYISIETIKAYLDWVKKSDRLPFGAMELFSKYIFAKRNGNDTIGIFPFLVVLFNSLQDVINTGEYPELRNPKERIDQIKAELSSIEDQINKSQDELNQLYDKKKELEEKRTKLSSLENEYSIKTKEYEKLKESCEDSEKRLKEYSPEKLENMKNEAEDMKKRAEEAQNKFVEARDLLKADQDLYTYYSAVSNIIEEHELVGVIIKYKRIVEELSENIAIAQNINSSNVPVSTAGLESAMSKIEPFYDQLTQELKQVVESLQKI